jgi:hypothetical protein
VKNCRIAREDEGDKRWTQYALQTPGEPHRPSFAAFKLAIANWFDEESDHRQLVVRDVRDVGQHHDSSVRRHESRLAALARTSIGRRRSDV